MSFTGDELNPAADLTDEDLVELELLHPEDLDEPPPSRAGVPATIAAVVLHVSLLAMLQTVILTDTITLGVDPAVLIVPDKQDAKPDVEPDPEFTLANPNDKDLPVQKVLNAMSTGMVKNDKAEMLSPPDPPLEEIDPDRSRREVFDIPEGVQVNQSIVVLGSTGNSIVQLESALDRVTHEIAVNLNDGKVLVVWMLDASASLQKQRDVIAKRLQRIYGELDALKKAGQIPRIQEPLLTGVVSYGATTNFLTREPVVDFETIRKAVSGVKVDESGRENVFTAVTQTLGLWGKYRAGRRIMLINVTDESGDDFNVMQRAVKMCRHYGARAYVIGPSAVFGRRKGYVPYVAPEDGKTYQIPVDLGPETARYENLIMPFWFEGPQHQYLSSGYGPYALSRLVKETGGIYFTTNTLTMSGLEPTGSYKTEQIKPFEPDYRYGTPKEYDADVLRHPLRVVVRKAAGISRDPEVRVEGTPAMDLRVTPQNFRQVATTAQETVARSQLFIDMILAAFPRGIERELEKEPSPRWRMNFCLTYGRLLAMHVRCLEYNSACAELKSGLTPQDVAGSANHWIFRPDGNLNYAVSERRNARLARQLLQRCIDEAPGTPWAVLAQRELRHPLGIRVIKRFIPPPKPRKQAGNKTPPRRRILLAPDPPKPRPKRKPAPKKPKPKPKLPRY